MAKKHSNEHNCKFSSVLKKHIIECQIKEKTKNASWSITNALMIVLENKLKTYRGQEMNPENIAFLVKMMELRTLPLSNNKSQKASLGCICTLMLCLIS
jgi:capsular polysaccharide biosynthesis protein